MAHIKLDREKCKGCMLCISVCPKGQLKIEGNGAASDKPEGNGAASDSRSHSRSHKPEVALNKKGIKPVMFLAGDCSGCTFCAIICPDTAIEVYK